VIPGILVSLLLRDASLYAALAAIVAMLAMVSLSDDRHSLPIGRRLLAHMIAAVLWLFFRDGIPDRVDFGPPLTNDRVDC